MTNPTQLPQLRTTGKWITDPSGNVVILHGVNLVSKTDKTPEQLGFDACNAKFLAMHGFSVVRLGVCWCNVQPDPNKGYDDNYLASLRNTIELLAQFGIYTLVDFHWDAYGAPWGYGAPGWAVVKGGSPEPKRGFPICTLGGDKLRFLDIHNVQTDCDYALDAFWTNQSVSGVPLWDRYLRMQQHVVEFLRGQGGNIFGYDVMNEPTPGSNWVEAYGGKELDLSHGCPQFDQKKLKPFYEHVLPTLRASHPEAILWFEPNVLHGLGSPTFLPGFNVPNIGFNFHNYNSSDEPSIPAYTRPVNNALAYQAQTGLPLLTSEFGGAVAFPELMAKVQSIQDGALLSYIFWTYFNNPTYPFSGHIPAGSQGIVHDMSKPLAFPNVEEVKLRGITQVYPRTISGTPTSFTFDPHKMTFHFEYKPILPSGQRGRSATHIVVPAGFYDKGVTVRITGGTLIWTPDGVDIFADTASTAVTVDISPPP